MRTCPSTRCAEVIAIPLSGFLSRAFGTRLLFAISAAGFTFGHAVVQPVRDRRIIGLDDPFVDLRVEHGDDLRPGLVAGDETVGVGELAVGRHVGIGERDTQLVEPLTEFVFGDVRETEEVTECADTDRFAVFGDDIDSTDVFDGLESCPRDRPHEVVDVGVDGLRSQVGLDHAPQILVLGAVGADDRPFSEGAPSGR